MKVFFPLKSSKLRQNEMCQVAKCSFQLRRLSQLWHMCWVPPIGSECLQKTWSFAFTDVSFKPIHSIRSEILLLEVENITFYNPYFLSKTVIRTKNDDRILSIWKTSLTSLSKAQNNFRKVSGEVVIHDDISWSFARGLN